MYTVGQVAKFLGISRDTLKFYEEKELINPKQDEENGYRKYNLLDINDVITVNFYRDIDIEIKKIQQIKKEENLEVIEEILEEKQNKLQEEIEYKKSLLRKIKEVKDNCSSIKDSLNKFTIREMKPIIVTNEIEMKEDIGETFTEILEKYDYSTRIKKPVNLSGVSRVLYLNEMNIERERYIFYKKLEEDSKEEGEIFSYPECIYTVIAVPIANEENTIDENMGVAIGEIANKLGYELIGLTFINLLFNGYKGDETLQYLEIYTPVRKI
ncbi:MAG: MerR family transcriptional regulator [Clostridium sp.]